MGAIKKINQEAELVAGLFDTTEEESAKRSEELNRWTQTNKKKLGNKGPDYMKFPRSLVPVVTDVTKFVDNVTRGDNGEVVDYIAAEFPKENELDYKLMIFTFAGMLFESSCKFGHYKENTGIDTMVSQKTGGRVGLINASTADIAREMYGVDDPTREQRKTVIKLVSFLKDTNYARLTPSKCIEVAPLIYPKLSIDPKTGQTSFTIAFCETFCQNIETQFGMYPRDVIKQLRKIVTKHHRQITVTHMDALSIFGTMKGEIHWRWETVLEKFGIQEAYKKNPSRVVKKIEEVLSDLKELKLLSKGDLIEDDKVRHGRKQITALDFTVNPDFINRKEIAAAIEEAEQQG